MVSFTFASLFLFLSHAVPSAPGVRPRLMAWLGRSLFLGLYSLLSLGAVIWFVVAYLGVGTSAIIFSPPVWLIQGSVILMPLAFFLMIGRVTTPFGDVDAPNEPIGIYRLCRFPGSTGILIWALLHLAATGDAKRVMTFALFSIIAIYAMAKNSYVLKTSRRAEAGVYLAETSAVPRVSVLAQGMFWREVGWERLTGAVLLVGALLILHPLVLGPDPLAWFPLRP